MQGTTKATYRRYNILRVARWLVRGKSLFRALTYEAIRRLAVRGKVLDIGARSARSEYADLFENKGVEQWVGAGLEGRGDFVFADVTEPLPFADETFDVVVAFNLFEHVYDDTVARREAYRVLKGGGALYVVMPFLHEIHGDPDDFQRLTPAALCRRWQQVGLQCREVEALGEGILTLAFVKILGAIVPRRIRPSYHALTYLCCVAIDRALARRAIGVEGNSAMRFALGFLAVFDKPQGTRSGAF
jgi:SAM-dependent methyltransferase